MSKDMFVNFTDNKADSEGIKNGTLLKFIFENSDTSATLVLLFPDFQTFKKDHDNLAGPIIESLKKQELKNISSSQKEFQSLLDQDFKDRKLKENEIINSTVTEITKNFIVENSGYLTIIKKSENFDFQDTLFTIDNTRLMISKKIKESFDPKKLFNPGRMYREF